MITATLSGTEPAPQEICYPILMKDKRDGQIYLATRKNKATGQVDCVALNNPGGFISSRIGAIDPIREESLPVYHGEITLKNS